MLRFELTLGKKGFCMAIVTYLNTIVFFMVCVNFSRHLIIFQY